LALAAGALASGAAAGVAAWKVREIRVKGAGEMSPDVIARAAGITPGDRFLATRMSGVAHRLRTLPELRSARIHRSGWGRVLISVRERQPVAYIDTHADLAVDAAGIVFRRPPRPRIPALEAWRGDASRGGSMDDATTTLLAEFARFPSGLRGRIVSLRAGDDVSVRLDDGVQIRFGHPESLGEKAAAAEAILARAQQAGSPLEYVDVRSAGTGIARVRATPPPPAPATPAAARRTPGPRPSRTPPARTPAKTATPRPISRH
jgi:cell division protein FtsQ